MGFLSATVNNINGVPVTATLMAFNKSTVSGLRAEGTGTKFKVASGREGATELEYTATEGIAAQTAAFILADPVPGQGLALAAAQITSEDGVAYTGGAQIIQAADIISVKTKGAVCEVKFREGNGRNWAKAMTHTYLTTLTFAAVIALLDTAPI